MTENDRYLIKPKFCPNCTESLMDDKSLLNEYWISDDVAYFCYCSNCSWTGEIFEIKRVIAPELSSI